MLIDFIDTAAAALTAFVAILAAWRVPPHDRRSLAVVTVMAVVTTAMLYVAYLALPFTGGAS